MRHLGSMNKQVLPTLHSQVREKKILNKYALSPCSWTVLTDWHLTEGGRKFCRAWAEKLLFYSHSRKEAKRPGGHI